MDFALYRRDYKFDLNSAALLNEWSQRITTCLPLIALYQPAQTALHTVGNATRTVSHSYSCIRHVLSGERLNALEEFGHAFYACATFANSFFNFETGKKALAIHDLFVSGKNYLQSEKSKSFELLLNLVTQSLYTASLFNCFTEAYILYMAAQTLSHAYACYTAYQNENHLELGVNLVHASISGYQTHQQYELIKQQKAISKAIAGFYKSGLDSSGQGLSPSPFGKHIHGYGQEIVKNNNMTIWTDENGVRLVFRVTHVVREQLNTTLVEYQSIDKKQITHFCKSLDLPQNTLSISMNKTVDLPCQNNVKIHQIALKDIGSISIGANKKHPLVYNEVTVEATDISHLPKLLELFKLSRVLNPTRMEDIEHMKIWHLFRTFYPKESFKLERHKDLFFLPPKDLKEVITSIHPQMKQIFSKHLPNMQLIEIMPASILDNGMVSTDQRVKAKISPNGMSPSSDYLVASADRVFTRLETKNFELSPSYFDEDELIIHFDLACLETGVYQYHDDNFGTRKGHQYRTRPSLIDFIKREVQEPNSDNEVMVRDAIKAEWIKKVVFARQAQRDKAVEALRQQGKFTAINNQECFNGKPLNKFFTYSDFTQMAAAA